MEDPSRSWSDQTVELQRALHSDSDAATVDARPPAKAKERRWFSYWLTRTREASGLRPYDCAKAMGIKLADWNQFEREHSFPSRREVEEIASVLGVPVLDALVASGWSDVNAMALATELETIMAGLAPTERPEFKRRILEAAGSLAAELAGSESRG